jgi:pyruvate kinase
MRNTKIVATLGPATDTPGIIRQLIEAGVNVFRLNASHGTREEHGEKIRAVRDISRELGINSGLLMDLQGPKIRLGKFHGGGCHLSAGNRYTLTVDEVEGNCEIATVGYRAFAEDVKPEDRVLLNDGSVELRVRDTDGISVRCDIVTGGYVGDRKGVNLPGVQVSTPSLTKKDMADLQYGLSHGIDMVALSFVRKRDDILRLRLFMEQQEQNLPIIAKIEKPEGWENIDQILEESDGVMVARGDLGVEMALEKVPGIQKDIIERARKNGKFVITATQMLESMVNSPVPTRAEVSDVANAIEDGTDAVMLSAETSTGKYPVEAVRMMARIAVEADNSYQAHGYRQLTTTPKPSPSEIVSDAAYRAASISKPAAIVAFTASGFTARLVARYRPPVPTYVFTPNESVVRQLSVIYGARAVLIERQESSDEVFKELDELLQTKGGLRLNDTVIILAGLPMSKMGATNVMKLHRIGELR